MMETICITGGAGFIGVNFVRHVLASTTARVVILDKLTYAGHLCSLEDLLMDPRVVFLEEDITDEPAVARMFDAFHPTALCHFAAETHVDRSIDDPRPFIETNLVGTSVLLAKAWKYFQNATQTTRNDFRFLHVSTDEVYGTLDAVGAFREESPYAPNSPYAATKAGADHLVRAYHETYGLPVLITNCSNNYGPYQYPEKLIPLMVLNGLEGKPLPIYGDGGHVRDWLFVLDHCDGVLRVLERGRIGEKYNIGGQTELTNLQVVQAICRTLETVMPPNQNAALRGHGISHYADLITFVPDRPGHDRRYALDVTKIQRELQWQPRHSFADGILRTITWYCEHRDWCTKVLQNRYNRERLGTIASECG